MSKWWHYAVEGIALAFFAVTAAAAAPVVAASEAGFFLAEVGMTVGEAQGVLATSMVGAGLATGAIVSGIVIDTNSKQRGRNITDTPFGTPEKKPRPDEDEDMIDEDEEMDEDEGVAIDQDFGGSGTKTITNTTPLVSPGKRGDFAGIQKTMYNPVTGEVIGLKMHARGRRGIFGGNFHTVKNLLSRRSATPHKVTHHSPVRPLGVWDSAYRH